MKKLFAFMAFLFLVLLGAVAQAANGFLEAYANYRCDAVASRANILVVHHDADAVVAAVPAHSIVHEDDGSIYGFARYYLVVDGRFVEARPIAVYVHETLDLAFIVFAKTPELDGVTAVVLAPEDSVVENAPSKAISCTTGSRNPGHIRAVDKNTLTFDFSKEVVYGESGSGVIDPNGLTIGLLTGFMNDDPSCGIGLRLDPSDVKRAVWAIQRGGVPRGFVELDMNR
ncbi:MAG: trypsin-like peptidase domain-containing protein [Thermoguttaceae bacterium]|nr:trypsin-like peptidase domain-containing protein [Thermoguttaceae bacterium]